MKENNLDVMFGFSHVPEYKMEILDIALTRKQRFLENIKTIKHIAYEILIHALFMGAISLWLYFLIHFLVKVQ